MKNRFLIISPCFNVEKFANQHVKMLKQNSDSCDLLLIDDHSNDETANILKNADIKVITFDKRRGKAAALKYGFEYAFKLNYDAVITIDSDFQHQHRSIKEFIDLYNKSAADYIVGKRQFSLAKMPISRIASNKLSSLILSKICGEKLKDSQCGFRLIDRKYLSLETVSDGFQFESEHLVKSIWSGAQLSHIDIPTIYNGALSSMKYAKDTAKFIRLFWQLMRYNKLLIESTLKEQA